MLNYCPSRWNVGILCVCVSVWFLQQRKRKLEENDVQISWIRET